MEACSRNVHVSFLRTCRLEMLQSLFFAAASHLTIGDLVSSVLAFSWFTAESPLSEERLRQAIKEDCVCSAAQCPAPAEVEISLAKFVSVLVFAGTVGICIGACVGILLGFFGDRIVDCALRRRGATGLPATAHTGAATPKALLRA